jgi:UDP-N-acetylglucosamine transferase subunit ALG13
VFISLGWDVTLAGEGAIAQLLKVSFPNIPLLALPGYQIRYAKRNIKWKIIQQIPKILRAIQKENQWLREHYPKYGWDLIISDNRPGFFHPNAFNIYLTHQLHPLSDYGKIIDYFLSFLHHHWMKPFNEIWVPDLEEQRNLSGQLSHPRKTKNVHYIGLLSRLQLAITQPYTYDLLILLSGPEPQRTLLETMLLQQIEKASSKILLIRGTTTPLNAPTIPPHLTILNLADDSQLQQAMSQSARVICRSGYTTIMDLIRCHKKALLIPTPGQTEQVYLAEQLAQQGIFPSLSQLQFNLNAALSVMDSFEYSSFFQQSDFEQKENKIKELVQRITHSSAL